MTLIDPSVPPPPPARIPWEGAPRPPRAWQREALPKLREALRDRKKPIIQATTGAGKSVFISEVAWLTQPKAVLLGRPIIIGVPSQSLVRQFAPTIAARCGQKNVGMFFADRKDAGKPIIVVCYASLPQLAIELALLRPETPEPLLMVCDEVHKTEAERVLEGVQALKPKSLCGMTATPFRSDDNQSISLFTDLVYQYTMGQAIRDGVLVKDEWRWDTEGGELDPQVLRMMKAELFPGGSYLGPGVVSAASIPDAEAFADYITANGFPAQAVHSRLKPTDQKRRIEDLRTGKLSAIVHVSMLAEGVDFPWLRWIGLRRPVGSAVRFIQEAGRVLRSDPENPSKTYGLILDPHNISSELGLNHDPAIGTADSLEEAAANEARKKEGDGPPERRPLPPGKAVELATQWTQRLALALAAEGVAERDASSRRGRSYPCSERQVHALQGRDGKPGLIRLTKYLPDGVKQPIRQLCEQAEHLQSGACSDLIDILMSIARATEAERRWWVTREGEQPQPWAWPSHLVLPELPENAAKQLRNDLFNLGSRPDNRPGAEG